MDLKLHAIHAWSVYAAYMATKTISIDLEAYQRLSSARRSPRDSFSQVIRRARWDDQPKTCRDLLAALPLMPAADEATLARLEEAQRTDAPPDNPWS